MRFRNLRTLNGAKLWKSKLNTNLKSLNIQTKNNHMILFRVMKLLMERILDAMLKGQGFIY